LGKDWLSFEIIALPINDGSLPRIEGENAREILLLFQKEEDPGLINFLQRVMRAVGMDLHKDTNFAGIEQGFEPSFAEISHSVSFKTLILFGTQPEEIGLHLEYRRYRPIVFQGKTILSCHSLRELADERASGGKDLSG